MPWTPTEYLRFEAAVNTSTQTCRIVTDAGKAFIKALGNRQGPHVLACELVATGLARWLGLRTFDFSVMNVRIEDEIPLAPGRVAAPGPAFVSRAEKGHGWGGDAAELQAVLNKTDIPGLVVFDTWTRNCDRCPPVGMGRRANYDNVFISTEGAPQIVAMDHSHCFTCNTELTAGAAAIERVQDSRVYGLFDGFLPFMRRDRVESFVVRLRQFSQDTASNLVRQIPPEWEVSDGARAALIELITFRAVFLADAITDALAPRCWPEA